MTTTTENPVTVSFVSNEDAQRVDPNVIYTIKDQSTKQFLQFRNGEIHWGALKDATMFDHLGAVSTIVIEQLDCLHKQFSLVTLRCEV